MPSSKNIFGQKFFGNRPTIIGVIPKHLWANYLTQRKRAIGEVARSSTSL